MDRFFAILILVLILVVVCVLLVLGADYAIAHHIGVGCTVAHCP